MMKDEVEQTARRIIEEWRRHGSDEKAVYAVAAALTIERDAAYVRGLERAISVIDGLPDGIDCSNAIQAEIDKANETSRTKAGKT